MAPPVENVQRKIATTRVIMIIVASITKTGIMIMTMILTMIMTITNFFIILHFFKCEIVNREKDGKWFEPGSLSSL